MEYECSVEEQVSQPVLSIRSKVPVAELPAMFGRAYGMIIQYLTSKGVYPAGPPYATYYNMDMQNLDVEAGFPVSETLPGSGEITSSNIPAGRYATCLHVGPYDRMEAAYRALTQWVTDHGYEPTGVVSEYYLNDPNQTPPEALQTRIIFPLK